MTVSREAIVAEARSWLGVPYRHQGWRKDTGCDCVGLLRGVGHALGLFDASDDNPAHAEFVGYSRDPNPELMRRALALYLEPLDHVDAARPGDVLWQRFDQYPRHLALLMPDNYVIHALANVGQVAEHRLDARWAARRLQSWRFIGVPD